MLATEAAVEQAADAGSLPGNIKEGSRRGSKDSARGGHQSPHDVATPSRGGRARGTASALEDLMRRKGVDEAWCALEEMQKQGVTTDKYTVSRMLMKTVGDGRTRFNPSRVYRGIALVERFIDQQPSDVDEVLFNALLDTCCRLKDLNRLDATVRRMKQLKVSPSPVTLGILVKTYGQAGDLQKVLQVWNEMQEQRTQANAVTYGCMIDACVKCGHLEKAVEIFQGMREAGKHKNTILYTTLIKGYGLEKDLSSALTLFREMPAEGVPYNTITYNSILDACIKSGDLATAESLLREMTASASAVEPDLITFSTLLKGYCNVGDLDKALQVVEAIKARGLRCDELVYNTLMDGCVKASDFTAGIGLFEEMVQNGMRPSTITHSILARLYQRAGYEDDASEAVLQLYQQHGLERPSGGGTGGGRSGGGGGGALGRRGHVRGGGGTSASSDRGSVQPSPVSSPSAASVASCGQRSESVGLDAAWNPFGMLSSMTGPSEMPQQQPDLSAPSTPMGSPIGSPLHGCRQGTAMHSPSNASGRASFPASCNGSPCGVGLVGMPMGPQLLPTQTQQLPPFPFMCGNQFAAFGQAPSGADGSLQQAHHLHQVIAVPVMQAAQGPMQAAMVDGCTGGYGGSGAAGAAGCWGPADGQGVAVGQPGADGAYVAVPMGPM